MSTQRNVLITGAGGGVGSALSAALAREGWRVFAAVRSRESAERLTDHAIVVELDVTDPDSIQRAAATVAERVAGEGLAGLVNNAGVIVQGPLELVPIEALRRQSR
jgi:NAD(P)-dependent dehydrogenase (short-subunit alcohol dehydrogenase family)